MVSALRKREDSVSCDAGGKQPKERWETMTKTYAYADRDYANRMLLGDKCTKRIEQGLDLEHYAEWAKEGTWAMKMALLERGYAFDILIHDDTQQIRRMVMEKDPSYMKYNNYSEDMDMMNNILDDLVDIDPEVIEAQIAYYERTKSINTHYLRVKLAAASQEPTLIERTMSPADLYLSGSPLWVKGLTFYETWSICQELEGLEQAELTREEVEMIFQTC